jgi:hypothetical protein
VLDLGEDTVRVGDEAVVFGDESRGEPRAAAWAAALGRSAAEVVSVFGQHLPRLVERAIIRRGSRYQLAGLGPAPEGNVEGQVDSGRGAR